MGGFFSSLFSAALGGSADEKGFLGSMERAEFLQHLIAPMPEIKSVYVHGHGFGIAYKPREGDRDKCAITSKDLYHVRVDLPLYEDGDVPEQYFLQCTSRWLCSNNENRHYVGIVQGRTQNGGRLPAVLYFCTPVVDFKFALKSDMCITFLEHFEVECKDEAQRLQVLHTDAMRKTVPKHTSYIPIKQWGLCKELFRRKPPPTQTHVIKAGDFPRDEATLAPSAAPIVRVDVSTNTAPVDAGIGDVQKSKDEERGRQSSTRASPLTDAAFAVTSDNSCPSSTSQTPRTAAETTKSRDLSSSSSSSSMSRYAYVSTYEESFTYDCGNADAGGGENDESSNDRYVMSSSSVC